MSKVSIIVPIYNVSQYLQKCLDSVAGQTYTDLEVLLVDDCGTDDSMVIAKKFIANYSGPIDFKILQHQQNMGLSAARNTGIKSASGKWLYFLDSDDWIEQDCIETLVKSLDNHPDSDIVFAGAKATEAGYEWMDFTKKNLPAYSDNATWIKAMMLKRFVFSMTSWNKLVNRNFILSNKLFFAQDFIHEDEIWNFMLAKHVRKAAFCKKNTYNYFVRQSGIMRSRSFSSEFKEIKKVIDYLITKIDSALQVEQALCLWDLSILTYSSEDISKSEKKEIKDTLKKLFPFLDFGTKILIRIFLINPTYFTRLESIPKIKGYINIKFKRYYDYSKS